MVVTTYDGDKEDSEQITSKAGIGYMATDAFTIGMARDGDDNYDFFARYTVKDQYLVSIQCLQKMVLTI